MDRNHMTNDTLCCMMSSGDILSCGQRSTEAMDFPSTPEADSSETSTKFVPFRSVKYQFLRAIGILRNGTEQKY